MEKEDKMGSDGWKNDSGVFRLPLLAYHGNDCLERSHLGCRPQGLSFIKARRFEMMEKKHQQGETSGDGGRVVVAADDATVGVVLEPNGALQRQ